MKYKMAENEYFEVGMIVACTTCHGKKIQGEVTAFDLPTKSLMLKSASAGGKGTHDVRLVNLQYVNEMNIVKEATEPPSPLPNLHIGKIAQRMQKNVEEKFRKINYIGVGVTPQAQKLFNHITKTIDEVKWDVEDIIVMNQVRIVPPYSPEHCQGYCQNSAQAVQHVKKLVDKYYRDEARDTSVPRDTTS